MPKLPKLPKITFILFLLALLGTSVAAAAPQIKTDPIGCIVVNARIAGATLAQSRAAVVITFVRKLDAQLDEKDLVKAVESGIQMVQAIYNEDIGIITQYSALCTVQQGQQ